ncbi:MAG: META domain-containing protein [Candidatus Moraniibacteriota bacterium]
MGKVFLGGVLVAFLGGFCLFSMASGQDLQKDGQEAIYFDGGREDVIEVNFYKKVARLSGKNFGQELKLAVVADTSGNIYRNEKNNLTLTEKNDQVTITIGDKQVFAGNLQKDDSYKNIGLKKMTQDIWVWENLIVKNDELFKPVDAQMFNLAFDNNGTVTATTNCANFSGHYQLDKTDLVITDLVETKTICANQEGNQFIESLKNAHSFAFGQTGNLILFLKDNAGSISFTKK